jgi:hypothetical protein
MNQVPDQIRTMLTSNPADLLTRPKPRTGREGLVAPDGEDAYQSHVNDLQSLTALMSKGDTAIQGSDINRAMIKQGAEIAALDYGNTEPNGTIADGLLNDASGDHVAVTDAITADPHAKPEADADSDVIAQDTAARAAAERMRVTCDNNGTYFGDQHVADILHHQWDPNQHGADNLFRWIGNNAGTTDPTTHQPIPDYQRQLAGHSATGLATVLANNADTLAINMPGRSDHASFGQVNPGLSTTVGEALKPYIANFAGANEPGIEVNPYATHLLTAESTTTPGVDPAGHAIPYTAGQLTNLFSVIDSNPHEAVAFNAQAAAVAGHLDFLAGAGNSTAALHSGELTGAMNFGLADENAALVRMEHDNTYVQELTSYNNKTETTGIVVGALNMLGAAPPLDGVPLGAIASTGAWIAEPIVDAKFDSPNPYDIDEQPTQWNDKFDGVTNITDQNPFYQQVNIINGYNSTHPGTIEQFNNLRDSESHQTYQFFDAQGNPNGDVIRNHYGAFQRAYSQLLGNIAPTYDDQHTRGQSTLNISPDSAGH